MCLGYVRASQYYMWNTFVQHPRVLWSEIHDKLKAGDVLLFVGSAHNLMTSMLTQVLYSHAAIIVSRNGELYMSESTVVEPYMVNPKLGIQAYTRHGTNVIPLLDRVSNYCGQVFVMPLNKKLSAAAEDRVWQAAATPCPYPSTKQAFMGLVGIRTSSRHCFQHTGHMIDVIGLKLKQKKPLSEMGVVEVVLEIVDLPGKDLGQGYSYFPIQNIQFDNLPRRAEFERDEAIGIETRSREAAKPNPSASQYRIDVRSIELFDNRHNDEHQPGHRRISITKIPHTGDSAIKSEQNGARPDSIPGHMVEMGSSRQEETRYPGYETLSAGGGGFDSEDGPAGRGDIGEAEGPVLPAVATEEKQGNGDNNGSSVERCDKRRGL
jgi:hypothetical protein